MKRHRIMALPILLLFLSVFLATDTLQAKGDSSTTRLELLLGHFHSVKASMGIQVIFNQGPATGKAFVQTTPTGARYLKATINNNGELYLRYDNMSGNTSIQGPTIVTLTAPSLRGIDLSSAATLTVNGTLSEKNKVDIDLSSASKVIMETVNTPELDADLSSSASLKIKVLNGDLDIDGSSASSVNIEKVSCAKSELEVSSAASVIIGKLTGNYCEVEASSGATVRVEGMECLRVSGESSSGANVTFKGKCGELGTRSSSGGRIEASGLSENKQLAQQASTLAIGTSTKATAQQTTPRKSKTSKTPKSAKNEHKSSKKSKSSKNTGFRIP